MKATKRNATKIDGNIDWPLGTEELLVLVAGIQTNQSVGVTMDVKLPIETWLKLVGKHLAAGERFGTPLETLELLVQNAVTVHLYPNQPVEGLTPEPKTS